MWTHWQVACVTYHITDLEHCALEQYIRGLEVTMDDVQKVQILNASEELLDQPQPFCSPNDPPNSLFECVLVAQLHAKVHEIEVILPVKVLHDIRV